MLLGRTSWRTTIHFLSSSLVGQVSDEIEQTRVLEGYCNLVSLVVGVKFLSFSVVVPCISFLSILCVLYGVWWPAVIVSQSAVCTQHAINTVYCICFPASRRTHGIPFKLTLMAHVANSLGRETEQAALGEWNSFCSHVECTTRRLTRNMRVASEEIRLS